VPDARGEKRNLLTLKATDDQLAKLAEKGASAEVGRRLLEKAGASKDDTVLVGWTSPGPWRRPWASSAWRWAGS